VVDFGFERVGAGRSERLDHVFISTYREQTHRIDKAGYGSEIWLRGVVLLVSEPSARTGLTAWFKHLSYKTYGSSSGVAEKPPNPNSANSELTLVV